MDLSHQLLQRKRASDTVILPPCKFAKWEIEPESEGSTYAASSGYAQQPPSWESIMRISANAISSALQQAHDLQMQGLSPNLSAEDLAREVLQRLSIGPPQPPTDPYDIGESAPATVQYDVHGNRFGVLKPNRDAAAETRKRHINGDGRGAGTL